MVKKIVGLVVVTAAVIAGTYVFRSDPPRVATQETPTALQSTGTASRGELERLVREFEARVAENPTALQYTFLGRLYLQQGKLTGDLSSYARAGEVLTAALAIYPDDPEAGTLLATTRYITHDFTGAITVAEEIDDLGARAVVGDASLELGRYDTASTIYDELTQELPGVAAVDARRSRLAFLRGDVRSAQSFAERAARAARAEGAFGPALAQYHSTVSTLAFERGDYDVATEQARMALVAAPEWHVGLTALARATAASGDTDEAIAIYRGAIDAVPEPGAVAALGDLLHLAGDDAGADEQYGTVEVVAQLASASGVFDRQLVVFWADHGTRAADAVAIARDELAERSDVYGHDALAWALLADGDAAAARVESDLALALGTRDARLLYHAGMISAALGDDDRARDELRAALDLNPHFDPLQSARAADTLEGLS